MQTTVNYATTLQNLLGVSPTWAISQYRYEARRAHEAGASFETVFGFIRQAIAVRLSFYADNELVLDVMEQEGIPFPPQKRAEGSFLHIQF